MICPEKIGHAVLASTGVLRNNQVHATKVSLLLVAWDVPEFKLCATPLHCSVGVPLLISIYDYPIVTFFAMIKSILCTACHVYVHELVRCQRGLGYLPCILVSRVSTIKRTLENWTFFRKSSNNMVPCTNMIGSGLNLDWILISLFFGT